MEKLSQNAKEQLALNILEKLGCFEEAKHIASKLKLESHGLPEDSVKYITNRYITALEMIDEACEAR
ncbi:hypothetical protein [Campylobacter hyointestinalis]|uniref:Uncharacterized protein n=1 Tax=Campylobacter hyointestinalis subsp. hyointestinalis TaxID=91352 RepID=A0A855N9Y6_CAMHY|nr:hypothetical protein [Campylobacter hyointestinalis]PPB58453.1 hypothetical protein CDQ70_05240 [Campylobacter hyointestinalis subsp. hyointestinalis]PPB62929.1 hypothetical protein CDQ74_06055 [Campylobacter hyointestinalis subsp. hyointestinalis]PPB71306.1 hypothetical protein CDQ78_06400 [Campylobacter hyointestinalis subsp. hyointestinalis]